jgi:cytochrome c biogenesis protein CcmG, thiol:disulfide interchange protein DsbE
MPCHRLSVFFLGLAVSAAPLQSQQSGATSTATSAAGSAATSPAIPTGSSAGSSAGSSSAIPSPRTSFVSLTDPACPVTGFRDLTPHTDQLHILYSPTGPGAAIQNPKSPNAHVVFEVGTFDGDEKTFPFVRRDDGIWQATVSLQNRIPLYLVYWIEDHDTKQSDTNHGNYFEVPFCEPHGHRSERSVMFEAQSYTGILGAHGIDRPVDFAKAIEVLTEYIHPPFRGESLISSLWNYKLHLAGDTPEARAALLTEINKFIADHSVDGFGLTDALNFTAYQSWIPADTNDRLVAALDRKQPDDHAGAFLLLAHSFTERDEAKQAALLRELIAKYPDSFSADSARERLFYTTTDLADREKLYQQMQTKNPANAYLMEGMASFYLDANQKLPEALALLAAADTQLDASAAKKSGAPRMSESGITRQRRQIAITRAAILVRQGQPKDALAILLPLKTGFKLGSSYFLLAQALENSGDKKAAIDAYLEATIRPWKDQQKASIALENLWLQEKMGDKNDLQQRIAAKTAESFNSSNYQPQLLAHPAPEFDLTTLNGEHFSNSSLRGKTVVLNLWATWCAPCLWELAPLQDFQAKHPELIVLTVVDATTDPQALADLIREKKLATLRIAPAPFELWNKLGAFGVPNTFVIDPSGQVRVQHLGGIADVPHYLEADLSAIAPHS